MRLTNITGIELNDIFDAARRVIDVDYFGARDAGATPETVANDIINEPLTVINFLLDYIDNLQG